MFCFGVYDVLKNYEDNACEMTYMYEMPEYMVRNRSRLEYCAAVWDPYLIKDINTLERSLQKVQGRIRCGRDSTHRRPCGTYALNPVALCDTQRAVKEIVKRPCEQFSMTLI